MTNRNTRRAMAAIERQFERPAGFKERGVLDAEHDRVIVDRLLEIVNGMVDTTLANGARVLSPEAIEQTRLIVEDLVTSCIRGPDFAGRLKEMVKEAAMDVAKDALAELLPDLEGRVKGAVRDRFEEDVAKTARQVLDGELARIVKKFGV